MQKTDIFYHLKGDVTNGRMAVVPSGAVSGDTDGAVEVSMG